MCGREKEPSENEKTYSESTRCLFNAYEFIRFSLPVSCQNKCVCTHTISTFCYLIDEQLAQFEYLWLNDSLWDACHGEVIGTHKAIRSLVQVQLVFLLKRYEIAPGGEGGLGGRVSG